VKWLISFSVKLKGGTVMAVKETKDLTDAQLMKELKKEFLRQLEQQGIKSKEQLAEHVLRAAYQPKAKGQAKMQVTLKAGRIAPENAAAKLPKDGPMGVIFIPPPPPRGGL
jgi:preprotein translocase subunit SecF